jgi:hypothetical protein
MTIPTKAGAAALASLLAMTGSHVTGQDSATRRVQVEFRAVATSVAAGTFGIGSFMSVLEPGQSARTSMKVTLSPPPEKCESNVLMSMAGRGEPQVPLPVWDVEVVPRRAEMDDILIEFSWQRWSSGGSEPDASDRGEAIVREDGRVLLDFLRVPEPWSECYRNVALELAASIPEDPAFADRRIGYDLWLVHEQNGQRHTRQLRLIGKQGEKIPFDYGQFGSPLRGLSRPDGATYVMETSVLGSVRGRIQHDGSIELRLAAERTARPIDGLWIASAHGEKIVRAELGETLRLDLPPPSADRFGEPETFKAIAGQRVALVLTPTLVE